jgi:hypothetical protein
MPTENTAATYTAISAPPPPTPPPDVVRLRVDLDGADYRQLKHVAIETSTSINEMACEAVRMLLRWYRAQGLPAESERKLETRGAQ